MGENNNFMPGLIAIYNVFNPVLFWNNTKKHVELSREALHHATEHLEADLCLWIDFGIKCQSSSASTCDHVLWFIINMLLFDPLVTTKKYVTYNFLGNFFINSNGHIASSFVPKSICKLIRVIQCWIYGKGVPVYITYFY